MNYKKGEQLINSLLIQCGYVVHDVSANPDYWHKDIDFIATNPQSGATAAIEVKYDSRISTTGNFFIETYNPRSTGRRGWFYFTEADLIYYIDQQNSILYILKLTELKEYINENKCSLKHKTTPDGASGYLINIQSAPIYNTIYLEDL